MRLNSSYISQDLKNRVCVRAEIALKIELFMFILFLLGTWLMNWLFFNSDQRQDNCSEYRIPPIAALMSLLCLCLMAYPIMMLRLLHRHIQCCAYFIAIYLITLLSSGICKHLQTDCEKHMSSSICHPAKAMQRATPSSYPYRKRVFPRVFPKGHVVIWTELRGLENEKNTNVSQLKFR